ncbi:flavodoxin family protein, partial [Chloroflexota bacterium]
MNINSATLVYFSPTRTTKTIVENIAQGMQVNEVRQLDLTPPKTEAQSLEPVKDDLVIIGAPVYAGRIPVEAVQRLQSLKGDSRPTVIVVVYGNRAYEDALLELQHLALEMSLLPIAGGAFIGEHSFSSVQKPIAHERPDPEDLQKAQAFGQQV